MSMKPISTGCLRKNAKTDEVKGNEKSVQTTLYRMAVPMGSEFQPRRAHAVK